MVKLSKRRRNKIVKIAYNTCLIRIIWKVDFVKYLRGFVLDSFHFHLMRRIFSLTIAQGFLQSL